jgi:hypothetical protein
MSGRKTFVGGDILLASELNSFLMDQSVMVFDDSGDRGVAIPSPVEGMVTYLKDVNSLQQWTGAAWVRVVSGFTAQQTITATDSAWAVPTLGNPIVKVTVIGGGGGGGGGQFGGQGGTGGTTTFDAGGAGTVSASGGIGGTGGTGGLGTNGSAGHASGNGAQGGGVPDESGARARGANGNGGIITVGFINLTGISTANVTIGLGGTAGSSSFGQPGGVGGRGQVVVEYVAG